MRLLLDTHVFLWAAAQPERLSADARTALEDPANTVFVSAAAAWEIAIKHSLGTLPLPIDPVVYVPNRLVALGFKELPISVGHAIAVSHLPPHHRDPFDRMMVAQAQVESLTLVTVDANVLKYPVETLKAD